MTVKPKAPRKRRTKPQPRFASPNLEYVAPSAPGLDEPTVKQVLGDVQRLHRLVAEAEKARLRVLHRLIRVDETMIDGFTKEGADDLIRGHPCLYAVRGNGDIVLWPRAEDGKLPDIYVE